MFLGGGKAGERRDSGASRAITKAMAKKICSTQSRVAALSHLPLSWQLLGWGGCGLGIVSFGAGRWDRQQLATQGLIELSQPCQRLGRTVEHQNADQQQESCRHALSQNHARPTLLNGAYPIDQ